MAANGKDKRWTFLTNHAVVYFHLLDRPKDTIREISDTLNLAERTVAGILADLRAEGVRRGRKEWQAEHLLREFEPQDESPASLQLFGRRVLQPSQPRHIFLRPGPVCG